MADDEEAKVCSECGRARSGCLCCYDDDLIAGWAADAQARMRGYAVWGGAMEAIEEDEAVLAEWKRRYRRGLPVVRPAENDGVPDEAERHPDPGAVVPGRERRLSSAGRVAAHTAAPVLLLYVGALVAAGAAVGLAWWAVLALAVLGTAGGAGMAVLGYRGAGPRCPRCGERHQELWAGAGGQVMCRLCWQVIAPDV